MHASVGTLGGDRGGQPGQRRLLGRDDRSAGGLGPARDEPQPRRRGRRGEGLGDGEQRAAEPALLVGDEVC